ncbi:copper amine oxidase [Paenibacillus darwinianus]|uniref:Copper amine oxidase n=1 Tax=Paenibacillus darwinianus TaxID=1380763 RepID=A0A9W5RZI3_9BACL|nr:stalk domain-containing protein [Paenibacillus darwinianus]EXX85306.1 copper amine oxidase [Paenibacillus darwinianus]EXX86142.1 copper amine oxidase [Paenibacillus darwinianus]EXX86314.1 copper amine oxidase [Paenibacillus darwinianus]
MKMTKMMMKMTKALILFIATAMVSVVSASAEAPAIGSSLTVLLDGKRIDFPDEKPQVDSSSRVLIPVRFVSQALGAKVGFEGKTVIITQGAKIVRLTIGSNAAFVNGERLVLDTKAVAVNGRTLVPLRFVSEALGQKVRWDGVGRRVWIGEEKVPSLQESDVKVYPLDGFKKYFTKAMNTSYLYGVTDVTIFSQKNFPIRFEDDFDNVTIYSVTLVPVKDYFEVQMNYSGKHFGIYYLTGDGMPRSRFNSAKYRVNNPDGTFTATFSFRTDGDLYNYSIKNWKDMKPEDVKYVGFSVGLESLPLLEKPFVN